MLLKNKWVYRVSYALRKKGFDLSRSALNGPQRFVRKGIWVELHEDNTMCVIKPGGRTYTHRNVRADDVIAILNGAVLDGDFPDKKPAAKAKR
jgi:hypothetical protein